MTRISKQMERRNKSPRRHSKGLAPAKTGSKTDRIPFKEHANACDGEYATGAFIGQVKSI
jgi:hypothetical protein